MELPIDGYTLQRLQQALECTPGVLQEELRLFGNQTGRFLQTQTVLRTPVKTGELRLSIHSLGARPLQSGLGVETIVTSSVHYAVPVELGSKPHDIVAKKAKALAFALNGHKIFRKKVHHPGSKGAHMFGRALEENVGPIQAALLTVIDRALTRAGL